MTQHTLTDFNFRGTFNDIVNLNSKLIRFLNLYKVRIYIIENDHILNFLISLTEADSIILIKNVWIELSSLTLYDVIQTSYRLHFDSWLSDFVLKRSFYIWYVLVILFKPGLKK